MDYTLPEGKTLTNAPDDLSLEELKSASIKLGLLTAEQWHNALSDLPYVPEGVEEFEEYKRERLEEELAIDEKARKEADFNLEAAEDDFGENDCKFNT